MTWWHPQEISARAEQEQWATDRIALFIIYNKDHNGHCVHHSLLPRRPLRYICYKTIATQLFPSQLQPTTMARSSTSRRAQTTSPLGDAKKSVSPVLYLHLNFI